MDPSLQHDLLLAAHALLALAWGWKADLRGRVAAGMALAVAACVWWTIAPERIPLAWLTGMQEGSSEVLLRVARGEGGHGGPTWTRLWRSEVLSRVTRLDAVVVLHLGLLAGCMVGLASAAARRVGWPAAALITAALAWSPPVRWAALSEGPAPLVWALALAIPGLGRWAVVPIGLLMGVRGELVWLGAALLLADDPRAPGRPPAWAWVAWAAFGAAGQWVLTGWRGALDQAAWVLQALLPQDTAPLLAVPFLLAVVGPGLTVAILAGGWRRPALGLLTLAAWKVYVAAGHGMLPGQKGFTADLELVRYAGLMVPALAALAVAGWSALPGPRAFWWALVCVPGVPGVLVSIPHTLSNREGAALWSSHEPLSRDAQLEVRLAVARMRQEPECSILTVGGDGAWWVARGRTGKGLPRMDRVDGPDDVDGCVWILRGLSCADHPCPSAPPGALRIALPAAPYGHPDHRWWTGPVVLETWPREP